MLQFISCAPAARIFFFKYKYFLKYKNCKITENDIKFTRKRGNTVDYIYLHPVIKKIGLFL